MKKDKILSQIKFKYHEKTDKDGNRPIYNGISCFKCRSKNIIIGGMHFEKDGKQSYACEDCAIDEYRENNQFPSREMAEAHRRRIFDVGYLFNEMITDKYLGLVGLDDVDDLNEDEMKMIRAKGKFYYNTLISKRAKLKMEEMEEQVDIEKFLSSKIDKIQLDNLRIKKKIELTCGQYENLLKMVYIGNWVINSMRGGEESDSPIEEFNDLESCIFSHVKDFNLEGLAEFDKEFNQYFPTRKFEEGDVEDYIENYDEDTFFDNLVTRFEMRDFFRKYSKEDFDKMSPKQVYEKQENISRKYYDEFGKYGIERLEIKK